jgi:hypothetical protein
MLQIGCTGCKDQLKMLVILLAMGSDVSQNLPVLMADYQNLT